MAVTGGSFEEGTGTEGNSSAAVIITADTRVDIQFNPPAGLYTTIDYGTDGQALKDFLSTPPTSPTEVSHIEITGLTKDILRGGFLRASPLGKIIKSSKRRIALKFSDAEIAGLTNMEGSFHGCTELVEVSGISASVTNMGSCFFGCRALTRAPVIPKNVTNMYECFYHCDKLTAVTLKCDYNNNFSDAFYVCIGLQPGSITVPANQLDAYKAGAGNMGVAADRFKAE